MQRVKLGLFLRWWLLFGVTVVSSVFAYRLGWIDTILQKDESYLCAVTFVVFYFMTIWCGFKTWAISRALNNPLNFDERGFLYDEVHKRYSRLVEIGWFTSDLCLTLGMAGTILGFIFMLSGFETFNGQDPNSVQKILADLGRSMATALYTTIVGLVCGQILKFQYFNLGQELAEVTNDG